MDSEYPDKIFVVELFDLTCPTNQQRMIEYT